MSDVLDRGAAAIWREVVGENCRSYEEGSRIVRRYMKKAFRACLAEIREPSTEQVAKGIIGAVCVGNLIPTPSLSIKGAYQAMIDTLLAEINERLESAPDE